MRQLAQVSFLGANPEERWGASNCTAVAGGLEHDWSALPVDLAAWAHMATGRGARTLRCHAKLAETCRKMRLLIDGDACYVSFFDRTF